MVKNNYPLPLIVQLVNELQGTKMFTKMDLRWGYNNIQIKEGDEWKAAFVCHCSAFEPLVMFFGLCNSPSMFQIMMNEIFTNMEDVVVVYIDDIMIFTKTDNPEEHDKIMLEVLCHLEENDLYVKPEKYTFHTTEVDFLRMIVGKDGIKMDQEKIKAVLNWPAPLNIKGVRSFLGLANFYQRFIQDYAQVMRPLNDLLKKDVIFEWKEAQQHAFDMLKEKFTTAPVLAYLDNNCQFCLECDTSNYATGAVLSILKEDKWHPVTYHSHSMSSEERNYLIADKEMLSVIRTLEMWRHYLEGAKHEFEVWNNHQNLQWFMMRQDLNRRQARWAQYLSRFNLKWLHKADMTMGKANALSRREDHMIGIEDDNKGVLVIPLEHVRQNQVLICDEGDKIYKKIKEATLKLLESEVFTISKDWKEEDGVIMKDKQIYIPDKEDLQLQVVKLYHDTPVAGHPGYEKMIELLQRTYFWLGMTSFVKDYISRCDKCARFKGMN